MPDEGYTRNTSCALN